MGKQNQDIYAKLNRFLFQFCCEFFVLYFIFEYENRKTGNDFRIRLLPNMSIPSPLSFVKEKHNLKFELFVNAYSSYIVMIRDTDIKYFLT